MTRNPSPLVVACLPAWNAANFIEATLQSLAAQTYEHLQILVSVDFSTDDTAQRCEAFANNDPRFQVIRQKKRHGWVGNVNALLSQARGDYCFFAFHDDILDPGYVACLVAALEAHPEAILAFTDMDTLNQNGTIEVSRYASLDGAANRVERARRIVRREGDWWTPHRGLFRSSAARQIGGLKRHLGGEFSADWPWLLSLALLGEFVRVPGILCHKRYMKQSLSRTWRDGNRDWLWVSLSAAREVRRAPIRMNEKMVLWRELLAGACRLCRNYLVSRWAIRCGRGGEVSS
ncbi:MAG: glycosyltransferase [Verrucomicrobiota bacterium]|nr:glycosyltransferase [Verrucomicrobiota bacterium]